jgi:hypothetical protein
MGLGCGEKPHSDEALLTKHVLTLQIDLNLYKLKKGIL